MSMLMVYLLNLAELKAFVNLKCPQVFSCIVVYNDNVSISALNIYSIVLD